MSLCWSSVKRVSVWKPWDLDNILSMGDLLYKELGLLHSLALEELPNEVILHGQKLDVIKLKIEHGVIYRRKYVDFIADSFQNS